MTNSLSPEDLHDLQALSPAERYDYLIELIQAGQSVWSLRSDQGTVLMSSDGAWEQRWLPGLQADGIALAVFPSQDDEGVVVEPDDMAASLSAV